MCGPGGARKRLHEAVADGIRVARFETAFPAVPIIAELLEVFPAIRPSPCFSITDGGEGDEPSLIEAAFAVEDDWTKIRPEWLDAVPNGFASALSFLSDEAVRFYIPAYLTADLMGALRCVDPVFSLTYGFEFTSRIRGSRRTDSARARWDSLDVGQAAAITHYLEWRIGRDGVDNSRDAFEALTKYWYARSGELQRDL